MSEQKERVIYAHSVYEVVFRGERVLHLRSLRDRNLIIHVKTNSLLLQKYQEDDTEKQGRKS